MRRRFHSSAFRLAVLGFTAAAFFCQSRDLVDRTALDTRRLENHGVEIAYPREWPVRRGDWFHFSAESHRDGDVPHSMLDYRGLSKVRKDRESQRQYAQGWYTAIALSYTNWRYQFRAEDESDPEGAFRFEGTYLRDGIFYRKIGILRYRGDQVHTFYYTAPEEIFETLRPLFLRIDAEHQYFEPVPQTDS